MESVQEQYNQVRKKYNLPEFLELDREFELSSIESECFLLSEIRKRMTDKINAFLGTLEDIVSPEPTPSALHEATAFLEEEKKFVLKIFRQLMALSRQSALCYLDANDESDAKFICTIANEWPGLKKDLNTIFEKLRESWLHDLERHDDIGYFG